MVRTDIGGVLTDFRTEAPLPSPGWEQDSPPLSFLLNGVGAGSLSSAPVDLSAVGEVYFTAQLYVYEASTGSNFEADDTLSAKLEVTRDDDTLFDINLIPESLDTNLDTILDGNELNTSFTDVTDAAFFARQLQAVIPANAKSVRVLITGDNDSTSEEFDIGGMLISDVVPGSDADGDGMSREVEMFAQTDPENAADVLRINEITRTFNAATSEHDYTVTYPLVASMWYTIEYSQDGVDWDLLGFDRATASDPERAVGFSLDATEDPGPKIMVRLRAVP
jgi:hypothetical protein